ncbi:MAG: alpha/beta hydrolase [Bacilli bacterium]|nr:alpha/beta hydrolase [Bacilli bacterium]
MIKSIKNIDINYIRYGNEDGQRIILLHGWGQNIAMMKPIGDALAKKHEIIILDLPGYGDSSLPPYAYSVYDYVDLLKTFLDELNITNPILIGHSFGGKISLLYASKYQVQKLVLLASPFKKEITKTSLKLKVLKTLKKVPGLNKLENIAKKHIGSDDYRKANPLMREILVKTVNLDITDEVSKITCPTIIIWGTLDEAVPLERAYELEKLINDAAVIVYEGCTHYAYLERINQTNNILSNFLGE